MIFTTWSNFRCKTLQIKDCGKHQNFFVWNSAEEKQFLRVCDLYCLNRHFRSSSHLFWPNNAKNWTLPDKCKYQGNNRGYFWIKISNFVQNGFTTTFPVIISLSGSLKHLQSKVLSLNNLSWELLTAQHQHFRTVGLN